MLGTVEAPDGRQLVVADVPGLIEGASEGIGLGHEFLAHLERARTLVHVIDASKPAEAQWRTIDAELAAYGAGLDELPQIVVLNKIDLDPEPAFAIDDERIVAVFRALVRDRRGRRRVPPGALHARPGARAPVEATADELADFLVYRPASRRPGAGASCAPRRGFRVVGTPPERAGARAGAARGRAHAAGPPSRSGDESFEFVP